MNLKGASLDYVIRFRTCLAQAMMYDDAFLVRYGNPMVFMDLDVNIDDIERLHSLDLFC